MKRFSRLYEQTAEFRARCKAFDFAVVVHAVLDVAIATKKKLAEMIKAFRENMASWRTRPTEPRKPHQLVLELNGIAQVPLFRR